MGGKVLVPTRQAIAHLIASRLAADVSDVPTIIIARTDANAAALLTNNVDERDHEFLTGDRTSEGFYRVRARTDQAISRAISYAPYADMIWCETSEPNLCRGEALRRNGEGEVSRQVAPPTTARPHSTGRKNLMAQRSRSCSASSERSDYEFRFVTLAGFHALTCAMFRLAHGYKDRGVSAYSELPGSGVLRRGRWLHRDQTPTCGRRRLFR